MKKFFLSSVSILLVISPVILSFLWHFHNQGWPHDDAAQYMKTAYEQYLAFRDGSLSDGLKALYQIRGWRPTLFPVLATPFLLLFKGNIPAASGTTLIICFLICQIYIYALARIYLDPVRASLVAAFVGCCPMIIYNSTVFFSEIAWLAFFAGFVFHLLKSDDFQKPDQSTAAGILLGLATLIRPAETTVMVILPLIGLISIALFKKVFSPHNAAMVAGFAALGATVLVTSAFKEQIDYRFVLVSGSVITLLQLRLVKAGKDEEPGLSGFNLFAVSFMVLNLLWWADSMPRLYSWIYNTSFGAIARITDVLIKKEGGFSFLHQILFMYLLPQGVLAAVLSFTLLLPNSKRNSGDMKRAGRLAMITAGFLLPLIILYGFTGTSDLRRIFAGMCFLLLLLSVLSLQNGAMRKVRDIIVALIVLLQLSGLFCITQGKSPSLGHPLLVKKGAEVMPKTKADQNETVISSLLKLGVPPDSPVAVYTTAMYYTPDRIYGPDSLNLAAVTTGSNLHILCFWDTGDYDMVLERLRDTGIPFLLIDVYNNHDSKDNYRPAVQFASALLTKMKEPYLNPPGLQRIAAFTINGREQILFKVLPD